MPNFCAAPNCTRKSTQSDLAFFRFPRDPIRCQKWVENCRRYDLEDKTPDQLNKHYRLCAQHFEDIMICRSSPYRTVLRENAIPTIFDLTSHLDNPGRRRKRIKELSEDEIQMLKERKRTEVVFGLHHSVLMGSKSFLDIELLIELVRLHPELYDPLHCSYNDSGRSGELWNQISSEIFMDWDDLNPQQRSMKVQEVQTKWQSLKENFRQELYERMWQEFTTPGVEKSVSPHFQELLFLQPVMGQDENTVLRPRTDNGSDEGHVQIVYIKEEPPDSPGSPEAYGPSPYILDHQYHKKGSGHSIEGLRAKEEEQDDEEHVDFDFEGLRTKEEQDDEDHVDFEGLRTKEEQDDEERDDEEHVDFDFEGLRTKEEQDDEEQDEEDHVDFEGLRTKEEQDDEDHVDFAQSLVPYLAQVPDSHQGSLRTDITNLIFCYIRNTRGHVPTISPQLMRYVSAQDDPST